MDENTPTNSGLGTATGNDRAEVCPTCGQSKNAGLEQFLGRLGINEEMLNKATGYAKENPGKVAAGVAALAVGAGLLISSLNRD